MNDDYFIILFYKFTAIENPQLFRDEQKALCESLNLKGRLLIAEEGINGTFEGTRENIEAYKTALRNIPAFADLVFKESRGTGYAFTKLQIKVRKEVVTLGVEGLNIGKETAKELSSVELHEMYEKGEDFVVLDLRNDFELQVGQFEKTIDPKMRNFRDLPDLLANLESIKEKKIVAVCTGGIRCEKATCLLGKKGFNNLYQLKDGIHTYMQQFPGQHFKGTLFVFDNRMTTDVVDMKEREIIGRCEYCAEPCETFYSDDTVRPSKKVICCETCFADHQDRLRSCRPAPLEMNRY